jgi:acyl-CoA thioesterase-1
MPVVVMLGDSLTAGYELDAKAALPDAVGRVLAMRGVKARLVNAGVSGATSGDGLESYDFSVAGQHPDLLIVALGANDFLQNLPVETPAKNLSAIVEKAQAARLPVALMGISVPDAVKVTSEREAAYAKLWTGVAKAHAIPVLQDMLAPIHGKADLLLGDGIHPTEKGVEAMAGPVADFIAPLVAALPE